VPTLTGRIRDDIAFVEEIIGVGEISVSELGYAYDSNGPGAQYVAEAATAGLLAGRLAKKRGYPCLQVPPYHGARLKPIMDMLERTGSPQTATEAVLRRAAETSGRGTLRFDVEMTGFEQDADGVGATLHDRASGRNEQSAPATCSPRTAPRAASARRSASPAKARATWGTSPTSTIAPTSATASATADRSWPISSAIRSAAAMSR
jgi:hypothetical protein